MAIDRRHIVSPPPRGDIVCSSHMTRVSKTAICDRRSGSVSLGFRDIDDEVQTIAWRYDRGI